MKDYAAEPYQFQIAGSAYVVQALGFSDLDAVTSLGDLFKEDTKRGRDAVHSLIRGKSDKRTADAVLALPPKRVLEFVNDWAGLAPGESSTSGE